MAANDLWTLTEHSVRYREVWNEREGLQERNDTKRYDVDVVTVATKAIRDNRL